MENWYTEARINEARLIIAPPEEVFAELVKYGDKVKSRRISSDSDLELSLLARNNPLIDIGLARYAENAKVVAALYQKSRATPADYLQERYLRGLRIACLSNEAVSHWIPGNFVDIVFGEGEYARLITEGDGEYLEALLCNPNSIYCILDDLYNNNGPFASLADNDRRRLVYLSIHNPSLATICNPESGNGIRKGIFAMLGSVPVTVPWLFLLRSLLLQLPPGNLLPYKESITPILDRWADVPDSRRKIEENMIDHFTNLSDEDEFRCLVAAMYGSNYFGDKQVLLGSPNSPDVVLRCAYYGQASLTQKQMKNGYRRDGMIYLLAVLCNDWVYDLTAKQKLLEGEQLSRGIAFIYVRRCKQIHRKPVSDWLNIETSTGELSIFKQIENSVAIITNNISSIQSWIFWGFILLATLILYKTH